MCKFKPRRIERLTISLRIDEGKIEKVDKLSFELDISRNEFLVQCIDYALEHIGDDKEKGEE